MMNGIAASSIVIKFDQTIQNYPMPSNSIPNQLLRQLAILLIIIVLGGVLFWYLRTFLPALLGAYTLYILLRRYNIALTKKRNWNPKLAAAVLMLISFLVLALPIYGLGQMLYNSHTLAISEYATIFDSIKSYIEEVEKNYNMDLIDEQSFDQVSVWATNTAQEVLNSTLNGITSIAILYFLLYFMLTDWQVMEKNLLNLIPLKSQNASTVRRELNRLVFANAIGIPVIGVVQGIAGLIIYVILGVPNPILWFVVTCIASMIPILGSALAYIPVSILLFSMGLPTKGLIMLTYGVVVIGSVDNVFRIWLQNKLGDTHPIVTLFGVIIGVKLFGFIGLIFGPILISLFLLLLKIYTVEFSARE
ncbi:MAG: AI-2E family transporter [Spirosomataceae bacterium]